MSKYKVRSTTNWVSDKTTTSKIDLFSGIDPKIKLTAKKKKEIKDTIGEFIVEQTLLSLADAKTPIASAAYESRLTSKKYKKLKKEEGLPTKANMENQGDLLDSYTFKNTKTGIEIGHFKAKEAAKADGHNNFSSQSKLPRRQYLPNEGQVFKQKITKEIDRIISENIVQTVQLPVKKLEDAQTKESFWLVLRNTYAGLKTPEIKRAIITDDEAYQAIKLIGKLKWLR